MQFFSGDVLAIGFSRCDERVKQKSLPSILLNYVLKYVSVGKFSQHNCLGFCFQQSVLKLILGILCAAPAIRFIYLSLGLQCVCACKCICVCECVCWGRGKGKAQNSAYTF